MRPTTFAIALLVILALAAAVRLAQVGSQSDQTVVKSQR